RPEVGAFKPLGLPTFDPDGQRLWAVLDESTVLAWRWPDGSVACRWENHGGAGLDSIYALAAGQRWVLAGGTARRTCCGPRTRSLSGHWLGRVQRSAPWPCPPTSRSARQAPSRASCASTACREASSSPTSPSSEGRSRRSPLQSVPKGGICVT